MASQSPHICFYSNRCKWSEAFISELSKSPYKKEFNYICVDTRPDGTRPNLPKWLEKTPTLVVKGEKEPRVDAEVMNWLYERRMTDAAKQPQQPGKASRPSDPAAAQEPEAWSTMELGAGLGSGGGSGYSFLNSDTSTSGTGGADIPGTYSFLNGGSSPGARGVDLYPGGGGGEKKTKREQMFDQQMEDYMKHRDVGMPKGPPRM
jgi:hypothetical protein